MRARPHPKLGVPPPRRVLVFRALKVGDMLCAVPALRAVRAALPEAEIVLAGLPWARELVARFPTYLDGFREFPGYPGLPERQPELSRIPAFLAEIQQERFDLTVQMHGSGAITNPLVALFGARRTAGWYTPGAYCPDPELYQSYPGDGLEVCRLLGLLRFLGIEPRGEHLEFPVTEQDQFALQALGGAAELHPGEYVCVHPGASVAQRRWPAGYFARVARALASWGFHVVLTGTPAEAGITRAIREAVPSPCSDLCGRTGLGALAALLRGARLLVCNDTGVSHLAAALRVPSVVLSTGDNPRRWAPADARLHRVLCQELAGPLDALTQAEELLADETAGSRRGTCDLHAS